MAGQPEPFARVERPFGSNDKVKPMHTVVVITSLRALTWCCVVLLAVLSLLPAHDMVRTSPAELSISSPTRGPLRSLWPAMAQPEAPLRLSAAFGCTLAFWSTSTTSLPVGIQRSGTSQH